MSWLLEAMPPNVELDDYSNLDEYENALREGRILSGYEGYVQVLDADGALVRGLDSETGVWRNCDDERCDRDGKFWRAACASGWASANSRPVVAGLRASYPPEWLEAEMRAEWEAYVFEREPITQLITISDRCAKLKAELAQLEESRSGAVERVRAIGVPWHVIGAISGVSRQAAWERWSNIPRRENGESADGISTPPAPAARLLEIGRAERDEIELFCIEHGLTTEFAAKRKWAEISRNASRLGQLTLELTDEDGPVWYFTATPARPERLAGFQLLHVLHAMLSQL